MQKGAFHISVNACSLIQSSEAYTSRALEMENSVMHRSDCMKRSHIANKQPAKVAFFFWR